MKKILRLFGLYFRSNLSAGMAYRGAFFMEVFGMALNNSAFIVFWRILFDRINTDIKGYGFSEVMYLWAFSAFGYGLAVVFLGNSTNLARSIYNGELDVYLLQPKPVLINFTASRMIVSGWGDLIFGLTLYLLAVKFSITGFLALIFGGIMMALVMTAMRIIYHSLSFFLGNSEDFALTAQELLTSFAVYPGTIFSGPAKWILHTLVPVAFMIYLPAELARNFNMRSVLIILIADIAIILFSAVFFRLGLRMYESGNKIGTRL